MEKINDRNDIELMAPAGSYEALAAAIQNGADAVYFGVEKMNMRARSSFSFGLDELGKIAETCRLAGIRSYLTLNIVMYDNEMGEMRRIIDRAKETGVSAIIASDMSVIEYARSVDMGVHISTQMNISNYESLRYFSRYADVVVLAREMNLEQVGAVHRKVLENKLCGPSGKPVKIELFVHGALCVAISGKCYMSLHETGASANRGECLQTCRKAYTVKNKETGHELDIDHEYIMSPKDLSTIHFLNKIIDSGVSVLKIEGRARGPEYVATVTACYDEAIKAFCNGRFEENLIAAWQDRLATVYNRGFWDGYYLGRKLGEWTPRYGNRADMRKVYAGKVLNYYTNSKVAEVLIEAGSLKTGEKILFIGPTTGVVESSITELRVDDLTVPEAPKGTSCTLPVKDFLRRSDKLYRWVESKHIQQQ